MKTENETKTNVVDSGVVVNLPTKAEKTVYIERNISCQTIADEIASRITGKLLGFDDLYDPKTRRFLTESELKAKGAVFITVSYNKEMIIGKDAVKKSRLTKEPTPFIRSKLEKEFLKTQSAESKQKEADKHGIELKFDPAYRTTRIDSCDSVRAFGFDYKPTENTNSK